MCTGPIRALLVNDDPDAGAQTRHLVTAIDQAGIDLHEAGNAQDALAELDQGAFDVLLVDAGHAAGGQAFLNEVRARGIETPAVMLDAGQQPWTHQEAGGQPTALAGSTWAGTAEVEHAIRSAVEHWQTLKALEQTQDFLTATLDALTAQIAILDARGVIVAVNDAWRAPAEAYALRSPAHAVGTNYLDACDRAARRTSAPAATIAAGIRAVLAGEQNCAYCEYPYPIAAEQQWFAVRVTRQPGDGPAHVVVAHESRTAQKRAEQQLNDLLDGVGGVIWESPGPGQPCTYINEGVEEILGYPRRQWLEQAGFWESILHPDDRAWVVSHATEQQVAGHDHELEYRVIAADGRLVWVRDIVRAVMGPDGTCQALRGLMLDITARKEAEEARRSSDERFRTVVERAPIGIVTLDAAGNVLTANAAYLALLGYTAEELATLSVRAVSHPDEVVTGVARFQRLVTGEVDHYRVEKRFLRKDGKELWCRLSVAAVRDGDGCFLHAISMIEDISDQRAAELALRQSEHRFRSLVQNTSDVTTILDADGTIVYESPSIEPALGYRPDELVGRNAFAYVHPDDQGRVWHFFEQAVADPETNATVSLRFRHADGSWRWIDCTGRNLLADPVIGGIVVNSRDATERKRHELTQQLLADASSALAESLDYTVTLERVAHVAVPAIADWCVVSVQDADGILRRLAVVHADPAKQPLADALKGYPPSDPDARNGVPHVVRTGETVLNVSFPPGHWDTLDDASQRHLLPQLGVTSSLVVPLRVGGAVIGAIALQYGDSGRQYGPEDVPVAEELARRASIAIEHAQLHQDVMEAETRFRALIQHASDMIGILDAEGHIIYESPGIEWALGYRPEDLVGLHCTEVLHPDELASITAFLEEVLQHPGQGLPITYRCRHADGSWRWLEATVTNLLHEPGIAGIVINARDVTERRAAEEAIRESEARFRSAFDDAAIGMAMIGLDQRLMAVNPAFCRMFGYTAAELVGRTTGAFSFQEDRALVQSAFRQLASGTVQTVQLEKRYRHREGGTIWCEVNLASVRDDDGAPRYVLAQLQDVTARKELEAQLTHQALHDSLTGLPNRTLLLDRLDHANAVARRHGGTVAVLFLDLDNFKLINDSMGHAAGDVLLLRVAQRVRACVREDDTVARFGGDEYVIVLNQIYDATEALEVAQRITAALQAPLNVHGRDIIMSVSIGIALSVAGSVDRNELLRNADIAMYRAKSSGKARFHLYGVHMHDAAVQRLELEYDLRLALERDELLLEYQPIIDLESGAAVGLEALVRWQHPGQGRISPAAFIPIAEETGLIVPIGEWVLREACRQAAAWQALEGVTGNLRISVNLSARQFLDPHLVTHVRSALDASGLPPDLLVLEITESNVMTNADEAVTRLQALRALGVRIAIDDFGTGYSSLAYLHSLPVEILKIDRSFVAGIGEEKDSTPIVAATVRLAQSLGLGIVAEGVETETQVSHLRDFGCGQAQGFLFSAPVPAERVLEVLALRATSH
jgi:diguanylate cyclase (GGDEF)-like protein/PAS domain S-box-containing protein